MATGKVKWFNNAKGYGFVRDDNGGDDLFVHYSYIIMEGYKTLKSGQRVVYEIQEAPNGLHAVNVSIEQENAQNIAENESVFVGSNEYNQSTLSSTQPQTISEVLSN